jgi:hypothetical protein
MNRSTIVLVTIVFVNATGFATGTLQIGDLTVEGNRVVIPVVLGGDVGNGVSALDFRLRYNPDLLQPVSVSAGTLAAQADKQVMANAGAPGEYAVVMMGMNQTTCGQGEVATVVMQRMADAPVSNWGLGIARQTLSALDGSVIPSEAVPYEPPVLETDTKVQEPTKPAQQTPTVKPASTETDRTTQAAPVPGIRIEVPVTADVDERATPQSEGNVTVNESADVRAEREGVRARIPTPRTGKDSGEQPEETAQPQRVNIASGKDIERPSDASREETAGSVEHGSAVLDKNTSDATRVEVTHPKPSAALPNGSKGQVASFLGIAAVVALSALLAGFLIRRKRLG